MDPTVTVEEISSTAAESDSSTQDTVDDSDASETVSTGSESGEETVSASSGDSSAVEEISESSEMSEVSEQEESISSVSESSVEKGSGDEEESSAIESSEEETIADTSDSIEEESEVSSAESDETETSVSSDETGPALRSPMLNAPAPNGKNTIHVKTSPSYGQSETFDIDITTSRDITADRVRVTYQQGTNGGQNGSLKIGNKKFTPTFVFTFRQSAIYGEDFAELEQGAAVRIYFDDISVLNGNKLYIADQTGMPSALRSAEYTVGKNEETGKQYVEAVLDREETMFALAFGTEEDYPAVPDVMMQITEVGGQNVEPNVTYPCDTGSKVKLEAHLKAPEADFHMCIVGVLDGIVIKAFDGETELKVEDVPETDRYGRQSTGRMYKFSGAAVGHDIRITIEGTVSDTAVTSPMPTNTTKYVGAWYVREDEINTFVESMYQYAYMGSPIPGGALCFLGKPVIALKYTDAKGEVIAPGMYNSSTSGPMIFLQTGAVSQWQQIMRRSMYSDSQQSALNSLAEIVERFVIYDSENREVGSFVPQEGIVIEFQNVGTYTLKAIPKDGKTIEFAPVTIEVSVDKMDTIRNQFSIIEQIGENQSVLMEELSFNGYRFKVNGKQIPVMSSQEIYAHAIQSMGSSSMYIMLDDMKTPVQYPSSGVAIGQIVIPEAKVERRPLTGAEMKIIDSDGSEKEAVTAGYSDPIKWRTTVNVSGFKQFDWIIELRYDVNNQNYVTGSGINPLFDYDEDITVKIVLNDDTELTLEKGAGYTLQSPKGYFKVTDKYTTEDGQTIDIGKQCGWMMAWYETTPGAAVKPYFLHPYYQKQEIRINPDKEYILNLLADHENTYVKYVVIENSGVLTDYAFTGGYGNPARMIAFGKRYDPIVKGPAKLKAVNPGPLEENENSTIAPDYYYSGEYTNIGFDATCVYVSSVTIHKVDELKRDLPGATFTIQPVSGGNEDVRVIQDQPSHLVLSHFIPGFSAIRPVPDTTEDISRRNLTSIGAPASVKADPAGDVVGQKSFITYSGLNAGKYIIKELVAPAGYVPGPDIELELEADLPRQIITGYEFCRWNAKVDGKEIPVVSQIADEYPEVADDAYQMFSCNSSCIVLRIANENTKIRITKTVEEFESSSPMTCVFIIEGKIGGRLVYTNIVSMTMENEHEKSVIISGIPVGAEITVTEKYSGASYKAVGSDIMVIDKTVKLAGADADIPKENCVSFTNTYGDRGNSGYGANNTFERSEDGNWNWTSDDMSETAEKKPIDS